MTCPICKRDDKIGRKDDPRFYVGGRLVHRCFRCSITIDPETGLLLQQKALKDHEALYFACEKGPAAPRGLGADFLAEKCGVYQVTKAAIQTVKVPFPTERELNKIASAGQARIVIPLYGGADLCGVQLETIMDANLAAIEDPKGIKILGKNGVYIANPRIHPKAVVVFEGIWDAVSAAWDAYEHDTENYAFLAISASHTKRLVQDTLEAHFPGISVLFITDQDPAGKRARVKLKGLGTIAILPGAGIAKDYRAADPVIRWTALLKGIEDALQAPPPPGPEGKAQRTEFYLAQLFLARFRGVVRYNDSMARWMVFDGRRWVEEPGAVERHVQAVLQDLPRQVRTDGPDAQEWLTWIGRCLSARTVSNVMALARPHVTCKASDFDLDPFLLNTPSGTLNLKTGALRPHRAEDMISKLAGAPFDPGAKAPIWSRAVEAITSEPDGQGGHFPRPDMIQALQRILGYALTGSTREQSLFFFIGGGSNGKGTLLEVVRCVLGDYAKVVPSSLLISRGHESHPADIATLAGVRLALVQEVNKDASWDEARMKTLTGGDAFTARFMYGNWFELTPSHKFVVAANHRPIVHDGTFSFWRRMRLIPFDRRFDGAEKDPQLVEKLKAELPGILAWCVRGCIEWQRDGLADPRPSVEAVEAYRADSSGFAAWADAHVVPYASTLVKARANTALASYEAWRQFNGEPELKPRAFWHNLQEYAGAKGFRVSKTTSNGTYYCGIEVRSFVPLLEATEGRKDAEQHFGTSPHACA